MTVQVTSGGTQTNAIPLFVGPNQINAILPSTTPVGSATLTVNYAGGTSTDASFTVVDHSFGINSVNQAGSGPGIIDDHNYSLITQNSAAQAGDVIIIWGTGLGAVKGEEANGPLPGNQPNIDVKVYVGEKQAAINYQGRSGCCAGVDQIFVVVPSGVTGCHVPIAVEIKGNKDIVSNWVTTSIAAPGEQRVCSDSTGPSAEQLGSFLTKGGSLSFVGVHRDISLAAALPPPYGTGSPTTTTTDSGSGSFFKYTATQLNSAEDPFQTFTIGTCMVDIFSGQAPDIIDPIKPTGLDAGTLINVNGPNGAKQLVKESNLGKGLYGATLGGGTPPQSTPLYLDQGSYAFDNGAGGADVKSFKFNLNVPPPLNWTNMASVGPVIRANGQKLTWTGGDPEGTVTISGYSIVLLPNANQNNPTGVGALFTCHAPNSAGEFTIPAAVLLTLPPSAEIQIAPGVSIDLGSLSLASSSAPVTFSAPGIDYGFAGSSISSSIAVGYQ